MRRWLLALTVVVAGLLVAWLSWPRLPEYVERRTAEIGGRRVQFLLVELPAYQWHWSIVEDAAHPKTVADWRTELGADVVFNAAYFDEDFSPTGFVKEGKGVSALPWPTLEEQADVHGYTFAVAASNAGLALTYLPEQPREEEPKGDALLSFPTLVYDGLPLVEENSYLYASRTMLAEDEAGRDYLVLTEKGSVTLYEAAQWLAAQPEAFVIAGNLDGGPSTGVSIENGNRDIEEGSALVPSVIVGKRTE